MRMENKIAGVFQHRIITIRGLQGTCKAKTSMVNLLLPITHPVDHIIHEDKTTKVINKIYTGFNKSQLEQRKLLEHCN